MNAASDPKRIATTFGAAATSYDLAADLQGEVAARLAERIGGLALPSRPRILEIGCGTGLLTRAVAPYVTPASWIVSDLAEDMLRQSRLPEGALAVVMDGERPAVAPAFDLICGSLAFQWFSDLPAALVSLSGLLAPGGKLAFSTLGSETFKEWPAARYRYPSAAELAKLMPEGMDAVLAQEPLRRSYRDGRGFLRRLRDVGAHPLPRGARPLSAGSLRRILRRFDAGITVTYDVIYGVLTSTCRQRSRPPPSTSQGPPG